MKLKWIDTLGDWNPQILREIKGRVKSRNLLIAGVISLVGQFLLFIAFQSQLPVESKYGGTITNRYCTGNEDYYNHICLKDAFDNFIINWPQWWIDLFLWMSVIGIFGLLVAGTYMLISDLAQEERRGTLNFIRLSPQSTQSILVGKIIGVPILLYAIAFLGIPLHLWAGISGHVPPLLICGFYAVLAASCIFFYSGSLLFGLFSSGFSGFQPWLGSGLVMMFLWLTCAKPIMNTPGDWLSLFSPYVLLPYLTDASNVGDRYWFSYLEMSNLQWFSLKLGVSIVSLLAFALANYALWTYWIWQSLQRRFPNPNKTILSKAQSYLLIACFETIGLGFAVQTPRWGNSSYHNTTNLSFLLVFNLFLFLALISTLSPQRQDLVDWARYRRQRVTDGKKFWGSSVVKDLVWAEKSPALVAIAINLIIASSILIPWVLLWSDFAKMMAGIASVIISATLIMIYAVVAQLMLLTRTRKQMQWAAGAVTALIVLPPVICGVLLLSPDKHPALWLFSPFPWVAIENASATTVFMAFLTQLGAISLCSIQLSRQLKRAGESATKALFEGRNSLPAS
ncbi:MAG TPA: hypothetical protein V6D28_07570 [Leptolyngbyaceae cyanobacterium]